VSFWGVVGRNWTWLGVLAMAAAAAAIGKLIQSILALRRSAYLSRAPCAPRQYVDFAEPGPAMLNVEGPRFSRQFAGVRFDLRGPAGEPIAGRPVLFRVRTSGLRTSRTELVAYDIPSPGRYLLAVTGLDAPLPGSSFVFMRRHTAELVARILGIVFASMALVTSFVFLILSLAGAFVAE
jgi:hypothetical protein